MRRIIDYANFGANHVGGMGSRRACCRLFHSFATFLSLACAFSLCMSFFLALRSRALFPSRSPTLSPSRSLLLLLLWFSHLFLLSFSFSHLLSLSLSLSLWRKIDLSTNWKRSLLLRQRCQLALRGRRSEFRRAKKGLKKCQYSRTYQTELSQKRNRVKSETVSKANLSQKQNCLKSETVSKVNLSQKWTCRNSKIVSKVKRWIRELIREDLLQKIGNLLNTSRSNLLFCHRNCSFVNNIILLTFATSRNHADAKC